MKVILLNGSPRVNGNTYASLLLVEKQLRAANIETEIIQLGKLFINGCKDCGRCRKLANRKCAYEDGLNPILEQVFQADGLVIGSPTYFSNVTSEVKAFIDRCGRVSNANGGLMKGHIGASVVAVRRAGGNFVYAAINFFFGIMSMPIATSTYWNMTLSRDIGDLAKDAEGIETFKNLGDNLAELVIKMR
jgi:multimeric flavodoxin WrbA